MPEWAFPIPQRLWYPQPTPARSHVASTLQEADKRQDATRGYLVGYRSDLGGCPDPGQRPVGKAYPDVIPTVGTRKGKPSGCIPIFEYVTFTLKNPTEYVPTSSRIFSPFLPSSSSTSGSAPAREPCLSKIRDTKRENFSHQCTAKGYRTALNCRTDSGGVVQDFGFCYVPGRNRAVNIWC